MNKKQKGPNRFLGRRSRGATFVEYAALVGLVALVAMAGFKKLGTSILQKAEQQATLVDGIK